MKKILLFFAIVATACLSVMAAETLRVYTYDSFISGIGKQVAPVFEKMYDCKVEFLSFGDGGNLVSRLLLERKNPKADVAIGISMANVQKALNDNVFEAYRPSDISSVTDKSFLVDPEYRVVPFDYGALAIDYNLKTVKNPPKSLEDLLNPRFAHSLVVEDPRTSSTGLDFLLWTIGVYGDNWQGYWQKLMNSVKTVTSGWDGAFQMLENGEAPMMVSFATDEAYNYYYYKSSDIGVAIPSEGAYVMVEYAGIVRGTKHRQLAEKFMDFVLSEEFQSAVPLNQWMYPVTDVKLPEVFEKYVPKVTKIVSMTPERINRDLSKWIREWSALIIQ